ncbi:MAG TPA: bifunctional serine/threonine-protein kinase/universal stress protein [Stellaceae bacterium]|nr:bifunctional serine/threonine-protein kinase/universal stress protein [Stellaceae bacterium]
MDPRKLQAGDVIDGFRLVGHLPSGGMSSFWRVIRDGSSAPMLMKIPLLRPGESPLTIIGYEVEQMILPRLSGPHAPRFVAAGDFERPYIVMEYIDGQSVKSLLEKTPLPPDEVVAVGAKVAFALHDIHRQHVIHLDLKPSNVILRSDQAVLIDFGLSRHDQLPDLVQEAEGPVGTGGYIAPEQILGNRSDPRSDLFALGVILYFLATGERPYGDPDRVSEWRRRLWRDPVPPRGRIASIPDWLQEIILRCLEISPDARYATAAQLAFDLQHPAQVAITERGRRLKRDGRLTVAWRWLHSRRDRAPAKTRGLTSHLANAPIIMVAIDLEAGLETLNDAIALAVGRTLATEPNARLACVNVRKVARLSLDALEDAQGRNPHLGRLIELKHWARTLPIAPERITYHVLEGTDAAGQLIDYARNNHVDHIVAGARGNSTLRRYLGSVSARVVAEAPCSVTVIRSRAHTRVDSDIAPHSF